MAVKVTVYPEAADISVLNPVLVDGSAIEM